MSFENKKVFTFIWKIVNFSSCSLKTGEKLSSPEFSAEVLNKTTWRLDLYPKGSNALCGNSISCFLFKKGDDDGNYSFKLEAVDSKNQVLQTFEKVDEHFAEGRPAGSYTFLERKLLPDLETSEDDILTIRCHLSKQDSSEKIMKCEARSEIQMENCTYKWKVQIPDITDSSKRILASFQGSCRFNITSTVSGDEIQIKVEKLTGLSRIHKLVITVFDDNYEKLELQNNTHLFIPENGVFEFSLFVDKAQLLTDSSYCSFTVMCDVSSPIGSVLSTLESCEFESTLQETHLLKVGQNFQDNLRDMLVKGKHSDVRLRVDDKTIPAHKSILSVRSPVFSVMFDQDMAENRTGVVDIAEVEHDVLMSFLDFLYTDELVNTDCEHVLKLILVADRYQVLSLKERCTPILMSKLSVDNVTDVIFVADLIQQHNLKLFALDYIKVNKNKILSSRKWSEWVEKNTKLAIQILTKLSVN